MRIFIVSLLLLTGGFAHATQQDPSLRKPCEKVLTGTVPELVAHVMGQDLKAKQTYVLRGGVEMVNPQMIEKMQQVARRFNITVSDPKISLVDRLKMAMIVEISGPGKELIQALMDMQEILPMWQWLRPQEETSAVIAAPTAPLLKSGEEITKALQSANSVSLLREGDDVLLIRTTPEIVAKIERFAQQSRINIPFPTYANWNAVVEAYDKNVLHARIPHLLTVGGTGFVLIKKITLEAMASAVTPQEPRRPRQMIDRSKWEIPVVQISEWLNKFAYRTLNPDKGMALMTWKFMPSFIILHGSYFTATTTGQIRADIQAHTNHVISSALEQQLEDLRTKYNDPNFRPLSAARSMGRDGMVMFADLSEKQNIGVFFVPDKELPLGQQQRLIVVPLVKLVKTQADGRTVFRIGPSTPSAPAPAPTPALPIEDEDQPLVLRKAHQNMVIFDDGLAPEALIKDRADFDEFMIRHLREALPVKDKNGFFEMIYANKEHNPDEVVRVIFKYTNDDQEVGLVEVKSIEKPDERTAGEFWKRFAVFNEHNGGNWEARGDEEIMADGRRHVRVNIPGALFSRLNILSRMSGPQLNKIISEVRSVSSYGPYQYAEMVAVDGIIYELHFITDPNGLLRLKSLLALGPE